MAYRVLLFAVLGFLCGSSWAVCPSGQIAAYTVAAADQDLECISPEHCAQVHFDVLYGDDYVQESSAWYGSKVYTTVYTFNQFTGFSGSLTNYTYDTERFCKSYNKQGVQLTGSADKCPSTNLTSTGNAKYATLTDTCTDGPEVRDPGEETTGGNGSGGNDTVGALTIEDYRKLLELGIMPLVIAFGFRVLIRLLLNRN